MGICKKLLCSCRKLLSLAMFLILSFLLVNWIQHSDYVKIFRAGPPRSHVRVRSWFSVNTGAVKVAVDDASAGHLADSGREPSHPRQSDESEDLPVVALGASSHQIDQTKTAEKAEDDGDLIRQDDVVLDDTLLDHPVQHTSAEENLHDPDDTEQTEWSGNGTLEKTDLNIYDTTNHTVSSSAKAVMSNNHNATRKGSKDSRFPARPKKCDGCFNSDFPMLIDEPNLCRGNMDQTIDMIFLIVTSFKARSRRNVLRKTWVSVTKNNTSNYRHVFLFGTTPDDVLMERVREESRQFRDVLVSDFLDSYHNLTLKTLMGLRWAATRCRHARFFLKVDHDVWVNTAQLMEAVTRQEEALQYKLGGPCHNKSVVIRSPWSKWYVPHSHLPDTHYPPKCLGLAYFGGTTVAEKIVVVSKNVPFFYLEDVYVGMCLQAAGLGVMHFPGGFQYKLPANSKACRVKKSSLIAGHGVSQDQMMRIWKAKCA